MNFSTKTQRIIDVFGNSLDDLKLDPSEIAIIFVSSIRNKSKIHFDYEDYSISASFQTEKDISNYNEGVRDLGIYTKTFLCEREFFRWVLDGGYDNLKHKHKIVYTSAVNGIGPGRRSLVPAFCAHFGIRTLNQTPHSATMGRHKHSSLNLLKGLGVPIADSWLYREDGTWLNNTPPPNGLKVIAKATYEGSSIGLGNESTFNYSEKEDFALRELSRKIKQPITVQKFINGLEFEIPVIEVSGIKIAQPMAVIDSNGSVGYNDILSYDKVWIDDYKYEINSSLSLGVEDRLRNLAITASDILEFISISRIDIRLTSENEIFVFDVSGTPDLTPMSSCATFAKEKLGSYSNLWLASILSSMVR